MDPYSNPQSSQQTSLDYLNTISAPHQTQTMSPVKLWSIIGGALLLVAIVFFSLLSFSSNGPTEKFNALQYRLEQLKTVSTSSAKSLQNSSLRALNGTTTSVLNTAFQESTGHQAKFNIKKYEPPKKGAPILAEYAQLKTKLDDARLNNIMDQVYAREIAYQLSQIRAELVAVNGSTNSESVKEYLLEIDKNIEPLVEQFNDFNNSQS